jgi:predicted transcriptional regulator
MSGSATITIRLKEEVRDRLALLSDSTNRTRSFLAAEAIADYVERELRIIEGVERGIADMQSGRLILHDAAMEELDAIIEDAEGKRA